MLKDHIVKAHPQRPMPSELMGPDPIASSTSLAAAADSNDSSQSADDGQIDDIDEDDEEHMDEEGAEELLPTTKIETA
jgi:hypothetical protein